MAVTERSAPAFIFKLLLESRRSRQCVSCFDLSRQHPLQGGVENLAEAEASNKVKSGGRGDVSLGAWLEFCVFLRACAGAPAADTAARVLTLQADLSVSQQ